MFKNIDQESVSQKIIEQIQDIIMSGELKAGDSLPPERELSEKMNVSRSALREAIKALEVMGIVECHQGRGNFIANNVNRSFYKPMSLAFKLSNGTYQELFEFRKMIEFSTAVLAAEKATPLEIARLYHINDQLKAETNTDKKIEIDWNLHLEIANIAHNSLISSTLDNASYLFDIFINRALTVNLSKGDTWDSVYREHDELIKAIESHDKEKAYQSVKKHFDSIMFNEF